MPKSSKRILCALLCVVPGRRRTGMLRPTSGPTGGKRGAPLGARHKRRPPRGMYINHDDLAAVATGPAGNLMLRAMDRELEALQRQVSTAPSHHTHPTIIDKEHQLQMVLPG